MKTSIKATVAAIALGVSGLTNAAMITQWGYVNEAGFTDPSPASVVKSGFQSAGSTILSADTWKKLSWGTAVNPVDGNSFLEIDTPITGTITTATGALVDGDFEQGTDIRHNNYRISGASLDNAKILDGLKLTAQAWNVVPAAPIALIEGLAPELEISFEFLETPNSPAGIIGGVPQGGICIDGSVAGTDPNAPDFGCDDYFIISPIAGVTITINDLGDADPSNDYIEFKNTFDLVDLGFPAALAASLDLVTKYEVTTRLTGLAINTLYCGSQSTPCLGFRTEELASNLLEASFAIRAVLVPAPASLALLGLGLFGLAMNARRKNS